MPRAAAGRELPRLLARPSHHADRRERADPEDGLAAPDTAVAQVPWPVAAVVRVHYLQRANPVPVEIDGHHQVRRRVRDLDDLDHRAAVQRDLLARAGGGSVQDMRRDIVQQPRGPVKRHAGDHKLGPVAGGKAYRVRPGRATPVPLNSLHRPGVPGDDAAHVAEIVGPHPARAITFPAHTRLLEIVIALAERGGTYVLGM